MGMVRGPHKGDLIITFTVRFPNSISDEQRKKLNGILP